jgi:hypothetical protein
MWVSDCLLRQAILTPSAALETRERSVRDQQETLVGHRVHTVDNDVLY